MTLSVKTQLKSFFCDLQFSTKKQCIQAIYFFVSTCVPWESNPQPLSKRNALTTERQKHPSYDKILPLYWYRSPTGCVLSPLLYSLYTHDCVSSHSSTSIVKFADDTVVLGLVSNNDEAAYLDEVERLTSWCQDNCLSLNVSKTKELIVDFRKRQQRPYTPLMISGDPCGEGEQLQVPRCKHLRGPDMDCTHPNTGQESQAKAVPSATAEEIQGLTSYPENFLFRGHRKCTDSVHLSVV